MNLKKLFTMEVCYACMANQIKQSNTDSMFALVNLMYNNNGKIIFISIGRRFCEGNFLKFNIGSQPIIKGRSLICGGWG